MNALLARHRAAPVLSDHDGQSWHLHFTARGALPADAWGAQAATALAVLIANFIADAVYVIADPRARARDAH